jgi:hypothetical protein
MGALDCPDYKDKNLFDKVRDLFQNKKTYPGQRENKYKEKKRGFFKRLFGK